MDDFRQEGMIGYPVYKLIRAVNRQYPNNGFINKVDVREDLYDSYEGQLIDEDLRDLINEAISENYIHIARDEVFTFPTVPGQREYALPGDCDLRDIQEVVRRGIGRPFVPPPYGLQKIFTMTFYPNGGTGVMEPIEANIGDEITLPECTFTPPEGGSFISWDVGGSERLPGEKVVMYQDMTVFPVWYNEPTPEHDIFLKLLNVTPESSDTSMTFVYGIIGQEAVSITRNTDEFVMLDIPKGKPLNTKYYKIEVYDRDGRLIEALDLSTVYNESTVLEFTQMTFDETYTMTLRNVTEDDKYITIKAKPIGGSETSTDLYYNETTSFETGTDCTFGSEYEYIAAYFEGTPFISFDMTEVLTRDVTRGLAHPSVEPDSQQSGGNEGGGSSGSNPLADLDVSPIDDGGGGYGDNPIGGDDDEGGDDEGGSGNSGATPGVEPDPEEPIG